MSTNLQQAVKQSKVSTLPKDLKDIAEQMMREKFGEEKVAKRPSTPSEGIEYHVRPENFVIDYGARGGGPAYGTTSGSGYGYTSGSSGPAAWRIHHSTNQESVKKLVRSNLMAQDDGFGMQSYNSEVRLVNMRTGKRRTHYMRMQANQWLHSAPPLDVVVSYLMQQYLSDVYHLPDRDDWYIDY